MRVALDLEEVLADTMTEVCSSTDKIGNDDLKSWDIDSYTWQVYAGVSDALWRHDPLAIPPVEPNLAQYTAEIAASVDKLDIVTARTGVDGAIYRWLDHHNITYDDLISTDQPKNRLDYDVYIDDNPEMIGTCRLLLRHQEHNADEQLHKSVTRINSLSEVTEFLPGNEA